MTKQQPVVTTRCGQQKQTRSTPMFVFEIRHSSLECLRLPVCLLLEPSLHRSSHSPYSTALLSETRRACCWRSEVSGSLHLGRAAGVTGRENWFLCEGSLYLTRKFTALGRFTTQSFFFFPLLPLLLLLIKKNKTKNGCHIWYNTGSQRKAIVQQFLTTNTHLISSVALWKTQCMFGLFNASKKLYY